TSIVDCEILIRECVFAVEMIEDQLADLGFGDDDWEAAARVARRELLHKKSLAEIKRAALEEKSKPATVSPEANFKARFMRSAQEILPADVYTVIFENARASEAA